MEKIIDSLINKIKFGNPVLFTGAGFSYGMENIQKKSPKGADDLTTLLMKECGVSFGGEKVSLKDIVDYYIETGREYKLISIIESEFTINQVCNYHVDIAKIRWRRCYTTNYDFGFEISNNEAGKVSRSINPLSDSEMLRNGDICVHMNGDLNILSKDSLKNEFALSDISYVLNKFHESYWYKLLVKDFESASAIVFIGYSLYDDIIKTILKSTPSLKEKTFIVTSPTAKEIDLFTLGRYGHVLNIGTEGFANAIKDKYDNLVVSERENKPEILYEVEKTNDESDDLEVSKMDMLNFIIYGSIDNKKIHKDYENYIEGKKSHFIPRWSAICECIEKFKSGRNIIITGEIGDGKSIFLEQLITHIIKKEEAIVYRSNFIDESIYIDYMSDIMKIKKNDKKSIIVCDDIVKNKRLLNDFSIAKSENVTLIGCVRSIDIDNSDLHNINFDILDISRLSTKPANQNEPSEVDYLISIIDVLNFWDENKVTNSESSKKKTIERRYNNQISEVLIDLFSSSNVIGKIKEHLNEATKEISHKKILFIILIFKYLNLDINNDIIKFLSESNEVDSLSFRNNKNISLIYNPNSSDRFTNKSSLFCRAAIKHGFSNEYKIRALLRFVEIVENEYKKPGNIVDFEMVNLKKTLIKEMMRFSNIDNLLMDMDGKKKSLIKYYDDLIMKASWLKNESHYWLQLSMAEIANNNLKNAQDNIDTAYAIARKKNESRDYSTSKIDTQQARIFIKKSLKEQHSDTIWSYFFRAHNLLLSCENKKHRYRQVKEYGTFYNSQFSKLAKDKKNHFLYCCNYMLKEIENVTQEDYSDYSIKQCTDILQKIVNQ
ncbi:nSTAND3 domain-containing NTPase [Klebsiella variicola]|uniref:nSTAND3 domain-containing NTPase n=1 Tax=Klebsiella variicola TaxID=244366 RepID=UPI000E2E28D6|nr:SIR2 family protein [Klebsiella variicola]SXF25985.1 Uncharacterised protein [Klebsiella variicola]